MIEAPVFVVATRDKNGVAGRYHVQAEFIKTHEDAIAATVSSLPDVRTVLCAVQPRNQKGE